MDRQDLEQRNRDELIAQAKTLGLTRPEVLTRAELIDEILRHTIKEPAKKARARGLLGRARDLLADIVERGLHLPEAAERIRTSSAPVALAPDAPPPVATVTLAEIYAAQGHAKRALDVLEQVLSREPDHAVALALKQRWIAAPPSISEPIPTASESRRAPSNLDDDLGSSDEVQPPRGSPTREAREAIRPPAVPRDLPLSLEDIPEPAPSVAVDLAAPDHPGGGPIPMLDDLPLPPRYDVDEAVVMPVDPTTAYVYWEVRPTTVARTRAYNPGGSLVVRVFAATDEGVSTRDIVTDTPMGDYFVFGLPEGATLQVLLGWMVGDVIEPLAFGPPYSSPPSAPVRRVADTVVQWTPEKSRIVHPPSQPPPFAGVDLAVAIARAVAGDAPVTPEQLAYESSQYAVASGDGEPDDRGALAPLDQYPEPTFSSDDLAALSTVHVRRHERRVERSTRRWTRLPGALGASDELWHPHEDLQSEILVDESVERADRPGGLGRDRGHSPSSPMGGSDLWG